MTAQLSTVDLEQGLALVGEWYRARSVGELEQIAMDGLQRLVPCDGIGWNELDLVSGELRVRAAPAGYFDEGLETLARLIGQNPIIRHVSATGDGSAVKISDFLTTREYRRLDLYRDLYADFDVEDQLAFAIRVGRLLVGVAFNRGARTFTGRERALLDLLRPHLSGAFDLLQGRAVAEERLSALERGFEHEGRAVLEVRGPHVAAASANATAMLRRWFGAEVPPLPLDGRRLVLERDAARLTVRLIPGDPPLLVLDETRFAPDPKRARALGLSRREAEVLALAARGLGNADIAAALVVSVRTIDKHLEKAYRKLGVGDRRQAAELLLGP